MPVGVQDMLRPDPTTSIKPRKVKSSPESYPCSIFLSELPHPEPEKIPRFGDRYQLLSGVLGKSISTVKMAKDKKTNQFVAVKTYATVATIRVGLNEVSMMRIVGQHPNVIQLLDVYSEPNHIHIVLEYIEGLTLLDYAAQKEKLTYEELNPVIQQVGAGLAHCHANQVAHHDIKLDNILFDTVKHRFVLIDFGLASLDRQNRSARYVGSTLYMSPELIACQQSGGLHPYDPFLADVWAFGVCLFILHYNDLPFDSEKDWLLAEQIQEVEPAYPHRESDLLRPLIQRMLDKDPAKRPNIQEVLDFPWFDTANNPQH